MAESPSTFGEEEVTWNEAFADLLQERPLSELLARGLDANAVRCITSDEHRGLRAAVRRHLPRAAWQRCQTHYQRNAAGKVPRKARKEVHRGLRDVFNAPDGQLARQRAVRLMGAWRSRFPALVAWMEETIEQPLVAFSLPAEHRKRMRTTNGLERYHQEARRRSRVVRIFPNRASRRSCPGLPAAFQCPGHGAIRRMAHRSSIPGHAATGRRAARASRAGSPGTGGSRALN